MKDMYLLLQKLPFLLGAISVIFLTQYASPEEEKRNTAPLSMLSRAHRKHSPSLVQAAGYSSK